MKDNKLLFGAAAIGVGALILLSRSGIAAQPNIVSSDMMISTKSPCNAPCTVSGSIMWRNAGNIAGTFQPAVKANETTFNIGNPVTLAPNDITILDFSIVGLPTGNYNICPYPGPIHGIDLCQSITVTTTPSPNIAAQLIDVTDSYGNPLVIMSCVTPCPINVTVQWINTGGSPGEFTPTLLIGTTEYTRPATTLNPGEGYWGSWGATFTTGGIYNICPNPNPTSLPCKTLYVYTAPP